VAESPGELAGVFSVIPEGAKGATVSRLTELESTRGLTPPRLFFSHTLRTFAPFVLLTVKLPGKLPLTQLQPPTLVLFSRMQYSEKAPVTTPKLRL
jgi:hypothetical protein